MRANEFLSEKSKDYSERYAALSEIEKIRFDPKIKYWRQYTPEMLQRVIQLSKITGRAMRMSNNNTVGGFIDRMKEEILIAQKKSGKLPEFTSRANTARDMAKQIAVYTNGEYDYNKGITWTTGYGQRYRDPSDYVIYSDKNSYVDAWQWVESRGKKVHYYDNFKHLNTAIQIGKYIIEPATTVRGAFSDNPITTYRISVRGSSAVNQGVRRQADITDQQASALKDIASTKNANAMEMIKALMNVFKGEEDVKQIIDNSKKITPQDKAKLDKIIAGAKNFKEPQ
jgi:hypothetical protein